jgi:hypothetical protein
MAGAPLGGSATVPDLRTGKRQRYVPFAVVRITNQKTVREGSHIRLVTIHAAEDQSCVAEPLPGNGSVYCEVRPPSMIQLQPVIDVADGPNKKATKSEPLPR